MYLGLFRKLKDLRETSGRVVEKDLRRSRRRERRGRESVCVCSVSVSFPLSSKKYIHK